MAGMIAVKEGYGGKRKKKSKQRQHIPSNNPLEGGKNCLDSGIGLALPSGAPPGIEMAHFFLFSCLFFSFYFLMAHGRGCIEAQPAAKGPAGFGQQGEIKSRPFLPSISFLYRVLLTDYLSFNRQPFPPSPCYLSLLLLPCVPTSFSFRPNDS